MDFYLHLQQSKLKKNRVLRRPVAFVSRKCLRVLHVSRSQEALL